LKEKLLAARTLPSAFIKRRNGKCYCPHYCYYTDYLVRMQ
jgi:hypothetical protein